MGFQAKLSKEQIDIIRAAGPERRPKELAKELGVHERTIWRYLAVVRGERREATDGVVTAYVKDRVPRDLKALDDLLDFAQREFKQESPRAPMWGRLAFDIVKLRLDFLGWPDKQKREFDGKSDAELVEFIIGEIDEGMKLPKPLI